MSKRKETYEDLFKDESAPQEKGDFAQMFEQSLASAGRRLKVGDRLHAELLSIGSEHAFVATGTPRDAMISRLELLDENGALKFKVGDVIEVVVLKILSDEIRVARKGSRAAPADFENLEDAFDMELPVEGKVAEVIKGGYSVTVQGQRAFCPLHHMELRPVEKPEELVGRKFEFIITQFEPERRNLVVSRRKLLEAQKLELEGVWLQAHQPGEVLSGRVTRLESYGAFVELQEGIEGLVHISEIGYTRIKHASEGLSLGEIIQVKILKISEDEGRLKISLSIKEAGGLSDPWNEFIQKYKEGMIITGTVEKRADYGLFVQVALGVTGLLPKSKWRDSTDSKNFDALKKGDSVQLAIDEIKFEERKVSLGVAKEGEDNSWREHQASSAGLGAMASAFAQIKLKK